MEKVNLSNRLDGYYHHISKVKASITLQSLLDRISLLAKKVFYFVVIFARPSFNVVLFDNVPLMQLRAKEFLNKHLPYRHKICFEDIIVRAGQSLPGKNVIYFYGGDCSTELWTCRLPGWGSLHDDTLNFLKVFDRGTPELSGDWKTWGKLEENHRIFGSDRLPIDNEAALKKFFT